MKKTRYLHSHLHVFLLFFNNFLKINIKILNLKFKNDVQIKLNDV